MTGEERSSSSFREASQHTRWACRRCRVMAPISDVDRWLLFGSLMEAAHSTGMPTDFLWKRRTDHQPFGVEDEIWILSLVRFPIVKSGLVPLVLPWDFGNDGITPRTFCRARRWRNGIRRKTRATSSPPGVTRSSRPAAAARAARALRTQQFHLLHLHALHTLSSPHRPHIQGSPCVGQNNGSGLDLVLTDRFAA